MIRKARKTDFPFVFPILEQIFEEMDMATIKALPKDQFYDLMKFGFYSDHYRYSHHRIWVATDSKDQVIGLIDMYSEKDQNLIDLALKREFAKVGLGQDTIIFSEKEAQKGEWYIDALAVDPNHWRKGIGSNLLKLASEIASQKGYSKLSLNVDKENHRARRLYKHQGFEVTSTMKIGDRLYDHMIKTV